jgi:hypothetical protein
MSITALLCPPHAAFLVLGGDAALRAVLLVNLMVAGLGAYGLGRTLGCRPLAALGGALAFVLGNTMLYWTSWTPSVAGAYAWLPAVMLCCERLLDAPTVARALALGVALTISLLPGYPQLVLFAYQIIALRAAWELITRPGARRVASGAALLLGLSLPLFLAAVQVLPALKVARESAWSTNLGISEIGKTYLDWAGFRRAVAMHDAARSPLVAVPCVLVAPALLAAATRRRAAFYLGPARSTSCSPSDRRRRSSGSTRRCRWARRSASRSSSWESPASASRR